MTVEFVQRPIPDATLQHRPDGSSVLTCPLCGDAPDIPYVLVFKPTDADLAEQCLGAHSIRPDGGRP